MALSVQTNTAAMSALKFLNSNSNAQNDSLSRLASGFRVNNAADDASGFAVSSKLEAQGQRLKAASLNVNQATAMVKMADSAVQEIQNMVGRIQSLAVQASSANNAGELGKLDAERIKLETQIDKIAGGTKYNGIELLNGKGAGSVGFNTNFNAGTNTTVLGAKVSSASTTAPNAVYTLTNGSGFAQDGTPGAATLGADASALSVTTQSTTNGNATYTVNQDATGAITGVTSSGTGATDLLAGGSIAFVAGQVNALTLSDGSALSLTMDIAGAPAAATTSTIAVATQTAVGTGDIAITNATGANVGNVAFKANSNVDAQLDDGSTLSIQFGALAGTVGAETNTVTISGQEAYTLGSNAGLTS
ncbi:MAG: hypothetical protein Q9M19_02005, partial [Mariprofundaceae bacterium]|nr:hypothetical protein [Mariprofundaceae bacterium]